jgi:hypothetical protein
MRMVMSPLSKVRSQRYHDENGHEGDGDTPFLKDQESMVLSAKMVTMRMELLCHHRRTLAFVCVRVESRLRQPRPQHTTVQRETTVQRTTALLPNFILVLSSSRIEL